jgi:hypothetical protein
MNTNRKVTSCYEYLKIIDLCVFSHFCCSINEIFTLPGFYAAHFGGLLTMFRENLLYPSSWVKPTQSTGNKLPIYTPHNPGGMKISLIDLIF